MTTFKPPYADPNLYRRWSQTMAPSSAGTGTYARNAELHARRLKSVLFTVLVAGTATTFVAAAMIGTATVGSVTLSTNTALYQTRIEISTASDDVASQAIVATKVIGDDTGTVIATYEFEMDSGAVFTQ